jgi:hypothetical protein
MIWRPSSRIWLSGRGNAGARLQSHLQAGDIARIQRLVELPCERRNIRDFRRRDQIKAAAAR